MLYKSFLSRYAVLALALPVAGFSAAVEANSVCQTAPTGTSCSAAALTASALTPGGSTSGSYNFNVTVGTDVYKVTGTYFDTLSPTDHVFLGFFPTVTVVSASTTTPDTVSLDLLQDFSDPTLAQWDGNYSENIPLVLPVKNSTGEGQVFYDGISVGLLGPVSGTGVYDLSGSKSPVSPLAGSLLVADFNLTFTFPVGSTAGQTASSPAPEPTETALVGLGLAGLFLLKARKFRFRNV
jgi:hypothetical protein